MKAWVLLLIVIFIAGCGGDEMKRTHIRMETTAGVMTFELYDDLVPITAGNFKTLAQDGFYDGQRFHRVIKSFMIQGGDPLSKDVKKKEMWGTGGSDEIPDEFVSSLKHTKKGLLSMANAGPNTGSSQFFITLIPTPWLDGKHALFGELIEGGEVLDAIGSVKTDGSDRPLTDVIIQKVSVVT